MNHLTDDELRYSLDICITTPNYRLVVVVNNIVETKWVMNFIQEYIDDSIESLYNIGTAYIKLSNNSIIYVLVANSTSKGIRMNRLIYDSKVPEEIIKTIYEPMYIPYVYHNEKGTK